MKFLSWLWNRGKPSFAPETGDRETLDVSRGLTPVKVDAILRSANAGDIRDQCRLAAELLEHNSDIAQAVSTRTDAVMGCHWSFEPGDESDAAKGAAETLEKEMRAIDGSEGVDNFDEMLEDLSGALLPGFAVTEILWENGGHVAGFKHIPQKYFTLTDSFTPRLVTTEFPQGAVIPADHILYHKMRFHGGDAARGGLIRPLAWLHCFSNATEKNLLAFAERYGMPFLILKGDDATWKVEQERAKKLIREFGSSGGALFTKNMETELLQAANSDGNIYFRIKESLGNAVNQLVLGQTASSGDGGGLSKDGAQDKVRRDILESDCRRLQRTINAQLCVPWTRYNFGSSVTAPRFTLDCAAPEDKLATAQMIQALSVAGGEPDWEEMSDRFGLKLKRREMMEGGQFGSFGQGNATANMPEEPDATYNLNLKQKYDAMGVAIRAGLLTATPDIEDRTRSELGLPSMTPEVRKAWEATGGIRQPITLKPPEEKTVGDALKVEDAAAMADTGPEKSLSGALKELLDPMIEESSELSGETGLSDREFGERLAACADGKKLGSSAKIEDLMAGDMERNYR